MSKSDNIFESKRVLLNRLKEMFNSHKEIRDEYETVKDYSNDRDAKRLKETGTLEQRSKYDQAKHKNEIKKMRQTAKSNIQREVNDLSIQHEFNELELRYHHLLDKINEINKMIDYYNGELTSHLELKNKLEMQLDYYKYGRY